MKTQIINKKDFFNKWKWMLLQLLSWSIFTFSDFIEENTNNDFLLIGLLLPPVLAGILYLAHDYKHNVKNAPRLKRRLIDSLLWIIATAIFFGIIFALVLNDLWIVKQATGGWENFLNGIEYMIFPIFLGIIPIAMVLVWDIGTWIYKKIRRKYEQKSNIEKD